MPRILRDESACGDPYYSQWMRRDLEVATELYLEKLREEKLRWRQRTEHEEERSDRG